MTEMSKTEIRRFLMQGTLTGKLATVKKDGSPHIVPIWFVLDEGMIFSIGPLKSPHDIWERIMQKNMGEEIVLRAKCLYA
jgi:nitroimidazol reductase NimA-like FMN-containing flavoprotein (pyridoxamine 5'-phosphate oxidase superfamily)